MRVHIQRTAPELRKCSHLLQPCDCSFPTHFLSPPFLLPKTMLFLVPQHPYPQMETPTWTHKLSLSDLLAPSIPPSPSPATCNPPSTLSYLDCIPGIAHSTDECVHKQDLICHHVDQVLEMSVHGLHIHFWPLFYGLDMQVCMHMYGLLPSASLGKKMTGREKGV